MTSGAPERRVVNASPIILLGKAGIVELLPQLCIELVVPGGVVVEVALGHMADAGRTWLADAGRQYLRMVPQLHPALANWGGGAGEAEVISWAMQHPGFTAILDDRAARNLAAKHAVPVIGTLRVIVLAKERGFIPKARPILERLRGAGAYVSEVLVDRAISLAGES
jgi:predicted nucleic acid-binding protein